VRHRPDERGGYRCKPNATASHLDSTRFVWRPRNMLDHIILTVSDVDRTLPDVPEISMIGWAGH
jgi:hypothetical protein